MRNNVESPPPTPRHFSKARFLTSIAVVLRDTGDAFFENGVSILPAAEIRLLIPIGQEKGNI